MIIQTVLKPIMQINTVDEQITSIRDKTITSTPNARTRNSSIIRKREIEITYDVVAAVVAAIAAADLSLMLRLPKRPWTSGKKSSFGNSSSDDVVVLVVALS